MSKQNGAQSPAKRQRSRQANKQNSQPELALQRPANADKEAWKVYWIAQGQLWRTEPEIDKERQEFLADRRAIKPDIKQSIYPFKDIKLSRADIEWLLATHENRHGPVDWSNENQRRREGLDLRGAHLSQVDLSRLPLARLCGGLLLSEWSTATKEQIEAAAIHLDGANLRETHVEGGILIGASMRNADLRQAYLNDAVLRNAHLEEVDFRWAYLDKALLMEAHMERCNLTGAHLEHARLLEVHLEGADLTVAFLRDARCDGAHLEGAFLVTAHLEEAQLQEAHLEWAVLYQAHLERAWLNGAHLEGTDLRRAHLEGANLSGAHLEGKNVLPEDLKRVKQCFHDYPSLELRRPDWKDRPDFPPLLPPADLQGCFFDAGTQLENTTLGNAILGEEGHRFVKLADVSWNGANLAVVDWKLVSR